MSAIREICLSLEEVLALVDSLQLIRGIPSRNLAS